MPDTSLTPEAQARGDRDPADFEPSLDGTERQVRRILGAYEERDTVPHREFERLGQGLLNTITEAKRVREERNRARSLAVRLENENAELAEQVRRVRSWATSHEYRWLHELLDGFGTHGGHL